MNHILFFISIFILIADLTNADIITIALASKTIEDSELNTPLLDLQAVPNSIVGGVVNVITGSYFESTPELPIPGANSFVVRRCYCSSSKENGILGFGWDLDFKTSITLGLKSIDEDDNQVWYGLLNDRGAKLLFEGPLHRNRSVTFDLDEKQLKFGVTNCASGAIGSRRNIKNKKLNLGPNLKECELKNETGETIYFKCSSENAQKKEFLATHNSLPNGCCLKYKYLHDRLSQIASKGKSENLLCQIDFDFINQTLSSSQGRIVEYSHSIPK